MEEERLRALHALDVLDTPSEERFDRVVRLAQRLFGVPMAAVTLIDADRQWHKANVGLGAFREGDRRYAFCDHTIRQAGPLVVPDALADERFRTNPYVVNPPSIRFYAGQPLTAPGGYRVGALCIVDTRPRQMSAADLDLLRDLADWVEKELATEQELGRAAAVQRSLLPRSAPHVPGFQLAGRCLPARDVSGDFFDYHPVPGGVQLTIADVMGKGVAAAILAASIRSTLRAATSFDGVADAVNRSADALEPELDAAEMFVTLFTARLEPGTGGLEFVDAGHGLTMIVARSGALHPLATDGLPLGALPGHRWAARRGALAPGDTFVSFSDGLLDHFDSFAAATNAVADIVGNAADADDVVAGFERLAGTGMRRDDVTVLVARRLPI